MSYCPTLQLLQSRETWGPFLESPPKFAGTGLPKTGGPEKKKTRPTPNDYEVLVIWVRSVLTEWIKFQFRLHQFPDPYQ